jgi:transcriptional regulatory protein GAL4
VPSITLEDALAGLSKSASQRGNFQVVSQASPPLTSPSNAELSVLQSESAQSAQSDPGDYEFDESHELGELIDGMGFLTAESCRSGYTGPTSGIAALRLLRSLPSENDADTGLIAGNISQIPATHSLTDVSIDVDDLINDYFMLYHPAYPLLHEGLFRARVLGMFALLVVLSRN